MLYNEGRGILLRLFSILLLFTLLWSCSQAPEEKKEEAIDVALSHLSKGECEKAIKLLEDLGRQNDDAVYLQVLASAYACRADFDAIDFLRSDLPTIDSSELLKSLALMTLSDESETDSVTYSDLRRGLGILLDSDGATQPLHTERERIFGTRKAGDMSVQILMLSLVQLGKWTNHFGSIGSGGIKGTGDSGTNTCFMAYTYANAQAVAASAAGTVCNAPYPGHADLSLVTDVEETKRRLCEGMMLITNIMDILENLDFTDNSTLSSLTTIATEVNTLKTTLLATDPTLATILNLTSQASCETLLDTPAELNKMQLLVANIFEIGI